VCVVAADGAFGLLGVRGGDVSGVADGDGGEHAGEVVPLPEFVLMGDLDAGAELVEPAQVADRLGHGLVDVVADYPVAAVPLHEAWDVRAFQLDYLQGAIGAKQGDVVLVERDEVAAGDARCPSLR